MDQNTSSNNNNTLVTVNANAYTPSALSPSMKMNDTSVSNAHLNNYLFEDELWDKFEEVFSRLTRGRHDLKKLKAYVEERSECERVYARLLKKNHENIEYEFNEASSLTSCFKDIYSCGHNLTKQHEQFANVCAEIASNLEKTIVELKNVKTKLSIYYKKLVSDRNSRRQIYEKLKVAYSDSVKVAEAAVQARDSGKNQTYKNQAAQTKQMEKLESAMKARIKEVDLAHVAYRKSVEQLVESQKQYDIGMIDIMQQFEKLERSRLISLNEQLDRFAQSHDFLKSSLDQITQFIQKGIARINIPKDIQDFICKHRSGASHPPYVEYECIKSSIIDNANNSISPNSFSNVASMSSTFVSPSSNPNVSASTSTAPLIAQSAAYIPLQHQQLPPPSQMIATGTGITTATASSTVTTKSNHLSSNNLLPEPPSNPVPVLNYNVALALYDFESTEPDDLSFKAGDIIQLITSNIGDDWWEGELQGRRGIFPKTYTSKPDEAGRFYGYDGNFIGTVASIGDGGADARAAIEGKPQSESESTSTAVLASAPSPLPAPAPGSGSGSSFSSGYGSGPGSLQVINNASSSSPNHVVKEESYSNYQQIDNSQNVQAATNLATNEENDQPKLINTTCVALYDFEGQDSDELSFKAGDHLLVTGELNGWYLGRLLNSPPTDKIGIFPMNYTEPLHK